MSTELMKPKYKKKGRPSNIEKEKALAALAQAAKATQATQENVPEPVIQKPITKSKKKVIKEEDKVDINNMQQFVDDGDADKVVIKDVAQGDGKITTITLLEQDYLRYKEIELAVKELLRGADRISKYLGYGKSLNLPDNKGSQEGPGVRRLRELVGM